VHALDVALDASALFMTQERVRIVLDECFASQSENDLRDNVVGRA
jgi:hypothetical protein